MLTIQNYQKIKSMETQSFSPGGGITKWIVASIDEQPSFYKLALMADEGNIAYNIKKVEYIWVWRQLMDNGFEYQIDCTSLTNRRFEIHCQYLKDPIHLLEWISSRLLPKLC